MNEVVDVMLRENFHNVTEDRLGQIDKGGIYYINARKKIYEKVNPYLPPYVYFQGLHAHDNRGNKYIFYADCNEEKVRRLYKDSVAIEGRMIELTRN